MSERLASEWLGQALQRWRRGKRSFDNRALKERRLIVIAALAVLWLLFDTVWLTPAYKALASAKTSLGAAQRELQALQELQSSRLADVQRQTTTVQSDLASVRRRLQDNKVAFGDAEQALVPARQMRELLVGLLAEQQRLQLVSMRTLPRQTVKLPDAAGAGQSGLLYRHGLEIKVAGSFHELLNWLLSIEALPRKLLWDTLKLEVDDKARLTLTVSLQTLSHDAEPMEISP
ncbi:MAG: hypothetical protein EOP40_11240 [Rubrivivax sp.]|nr:MAG: hypothetical protein EOP40_11240 [Rubrivivax sp.]